jgi:DNA-binding NtrC family response regulator
LKISPGGEARLLAQPWRGNIRELAHELERAVIFTPADTLDFLHLARPDTGSSAASWRNPAWNLPPEGFTLDSAIDTFIADALRETNGNVSAAARRLGVTREFLRYRLSGTKKLPSETPSTTPSDPGAQQPW